MPGHVWTLWAECVMRVQEGVWGGTKGACGKGPGMQGHMEGNAGTEA